MVKKTIHELAKEFPEKTYNELEKYRDADRQQEAQQILIKQENEELKEDQHKENWKEKYEKEHRLRQEVEGELSIVKGIGMNSPEVIKLKKELCEVRQDNRRLAHEVEDRITKMRKSGM